MNYFDIAAKIFAIVGVIAAIYNLVSSRKIVQEQGQKAKVEEALKLAQENKREIGHLKELIQNEKEHTNARLDQIGEDTSWMRDMFTKWLLDSTRKP